MSDCRQHSHDETVKNREKAQLQFIPGKVKVMEKSAKSLPTMGDASEISQHQLEIMEAGE